MNENQSNSMRAVNVPYESNSSNESKREDEIDILEVLIILKKNWRLLFLTTILGICVGFFLVSWIRNQYSSDVLLQIDAKGNGSAMVEMGALFDVESPAETEIRLLKSRKVLGHVVLQEHLHLQAIPIGFENRMLKKEGRMDLSLLEIPEALQTELFYARASSTNEYEVLFPEDQVFLKGKVGETYRKVYAGDTFAICVSRLLIEKEQKFLLQRNSVLQATKQLKAALNVAEDGKKTNIITMTYEHRYADKTASVLNSIANTYLRQNVEMRSAEAEKTLAFLEEQIPSIKKKLDSAEQALTNYRYEAGSVDLSAEAKVTLDRQVNLKTQLLGLEQQFQENSRLYKEDHPTMQAMIQQRARLEKEIKKEELMVKNLPMTQQEVLALQQDVSIQNELYSSMLNNIQQLRIVRVGELGNVRIVDFAEITPIPVKPKKKIILLGSLLGGIVLGCLIIFLKQMFMKRGISSSSLIERKTGVSVYAKIPLSSFLKKKKMENAVLAEADPNNLAVERLRALRTALEFSFIENGGKVLAITGFSSGEGKSFISKNLSVLFKQISKKVILVDCDLRKRKINDDKEIGLSNILYESVSLEDVLQHSSFPYCDYVGTGKHSMMPSELLASAKFSNFIASLREKYDLVIIDTPPMTFFSDAQLVCKRADFALVVIKSSVYLIDQIKELAKLLDVAIKNKAIVINQSKTESLSHSYYYKSKYYY